MNSICIFFIICIASHMLTLASLFPTQQGGRPHSLCDNDAYDSEENYAKVTKFRATGSVTLEAFSYLWKRAKNLQELRISGMTPAGSNLDNRFSLESCYVKVVLSLAPDVARLCNLFHATQPQIFLDKS